MEPVEGHEGPLATHVAHTHVNPAQRPSKEVLVAFQGVSKLKLETLLEDGWEISGVSIYKDGRHGFVTDGGFVGWWKKEE